MRAPDKGFQTGSREDDMKQVQREVALTNAAENFVLDIVVSVIVIFTIIAAIAIP